MKKTFAKLILLSALALVGCNGGNNSAAPASDSVAPVVSDKTSQPDTSTSSKPSYPDITITTKKDSYEVERGATVNVMVSATSSVATAVKTFNFELEQDKEYVTFASDNVSGVANVRLTGKAVGTATLIATSVANPTVSKRITITVIRPIAALGTVWKNIADATNFSNYTLDITRTPTSAELSEHTNWGDETAVPSAKIRSTANAIVYEEASAVQDDLTATWGAAAAYTGDTASLLGLGVGKNGYVTPLIKAADGSFSTAGTAVKTQIGLLNSTNFKGAGLSATSPNDVYSFYNLSAFNPNWFTAPKDSSNTYEISVDSGVVTDKAALTNNQYINVLFYQMVDPSGFASAINTNPQFSAIAEKVNVTITALTNSSVSIAVEEDSTTYTITMSDVGKTVTTDISGLDTYLASAEPSMPALPNEIDAAVKALADHSYRITDSIHFNDQTSADYYSYFTDKYWFQYFDSDFVTKYNAHVSSSDKKLSVGGQGYVKKSDGIYKMTLTPAATEGGDPTVTVGQKISSTDGNTDLPSVLPYYFETSDYVTGGSLYTLSDEKEAVFGADYGSFYYSTSADSALGLYEFITGSSSGFDASASWISGVGVNATVNDQNETVVNSISFLLAVKDQRSQYYSIYYTPTIDNIGKGNVNDFDAQIQAQITATK